MTPAGQITCDAQTTPKVNDRPNQVFAYKMNDNFTQGEASTVKPPVTSVGVVGWARANLFNSWFNSILTLLTLLFLWKAIPPFVNWAFIDSLWWSTGAECKAAEGACWSIITANYRYILFGFYPYELQWRPLLAMVILFSLLIYSRDRTHWKKALGYAWIAGLVIYGPAHRRAGLGLAPVESDMWASPHPFAGCFRTDRSLPAGSFAGLGTPIQTAGHPMALCSVYRTDPRGAVDQPVVYVIGRFSPVSTRRGDHRQDPPGPGGHHSVYRRIHRRGGSRRAAGDGQGQYEAAESLGLNYYQTMRLVILPQALKIVIPAYRSVFLSRPLRTPPWW